MGGVSNRYEVQGQRMLGPENLRNEYKLFKNVVVVERNRLIKGLEDSEKYISKLKTHQDDTMKCRCSDLESELDAQKKICEKLQQKVEN